MEYQIALAPELKLSSADFAGAWNNTPECRAVAEAQVEQATATQYDPFVVAGVVALLGSIATGLVTSAIYDLIKQALVKQGVHQRIEIMELEQGRGKRLLVVTIRDD